MECLVMAVRIVQPTMMVQIEQRDDRPYEVLEPQYINNFKSFDNNTQSTNMVRNIVVFINTQILFILFVIKDNVEYS